MPRLRKPRALPPGGTVAIAAPAWPVDPDTFAGGVARWREAGYRVVHRPDVTSRRGYLAGDDARRAEELSGWIAEPGVDAVVCARGGYGVTRILPRLDPAAFRAARVPVVGYSDVTALLLWLRRVAGLVAFHGPMLEHGRDADADSLAALADALSGRAPIPQVLAGTPGAGGRAEGRLVGGNLVLVVASLGTPWEVDTRGAILLLEEVGEAPYRIDRMLQQLAAAGKLAHCAGVGLGDFAGCDDPRQPEPDVHAVFAEVLGAHGLPWVRGLPFGHRRCQQAWPLGVRATIDGTRGEIRVLERGVSRAT